MAGTVGRIGAKETQNGSHGRKDETNAMTAQQRTVFRRGMKRLGSGTPGRLLLAAAVGLATGFGSGSAALANGKEIRGFPIMQSSAGSYLAARHAERIFALSDSATHYARALATDPDNPRLIRRAIFLMAADGRVPQAVALADRLVKGLPDARLSNLLLSLRAAKAKRYEEAERRLTTLPNSGANAILLPLLRGWYAFGAGDRDAALRALNVLSSNKRFASYYALHSGMMLELIGRTDEAAKRYESALKPGQNPGLRMVYAIGVFYERSGRQAKARKLYTDYLKRSPEAVGIAHALKRLDSGKRPEPFARSVSEGVAEALFDIGSAMQQARAGRRALIYSQLALYMRPNFAPAQMLAANVLERQKRRERALALYRQVPKGSPLSWSARLASAHLLDDLKRTDEAVSKLTAMAEERKDRWDAQVALGDILRSRQRFAEAVKAYDGAVKRIAKLERRHWGILYARGIALERSKQWDRAEKDFLLALKFEPNQPYVLNYLGYSWVEQGRHLERAREMIEKAVALRRNDGYITDSLGWVLYRLGRYKEAVKYLERAVELRPHDPTINDHLGDAYWMVGRIHEAQFQWRRALSLKPEKDQIGVIQTKIEKGLDKPKRPSQPN